MTNNQTSYFYEEVIDLRELIKTLLKYKWVIIGVTLSLGIAVFLVSSLFLPPTYEASAFVAITEPVIIAELDPSIQISPSMPDTDALAELAEAEEIKGKVSEKLGMDDFFEETKPEMEASLKGKNQVLLRVTTKSPELSAEIANAWADVFVKQLNELYGTGEQTIVTLEEEVENAREKWNRAQAALEDYLPQSRVEVLQVQLSDTKNSLGRYLNRIEHNKILVSDAEALLSQMDELNENDNLSTGNALSIIALQQRASGGISGTQFQIQNNEILGEDYLVSEGKDSIQQLIISLEEQISKFQSEIPVLETQISELSVDLEGEKFKVEQLEQERDLARNAYNALSNQLEETRIKQSQEEFSAKIATNAVVPRKKSGPNFVMNTALAAFLGLLISIGGTLFFDWWKEKD